jgi:1,4-dihydroxy-2-naphthoate octaprenyltransferase
MFGRKGAALIFAVAAIATPLSVLVAVIAGVLPGWTLVAALVGAWFVRPAVQWALTRPEEPVPIPAMAGNVIWNLATNTLIAVALGVAAWMK